LVEFENPGASVTLSASLPTGGLVDSFVFSPDGSRVAYRADQETLNHERRATDAAHRSEQALTAL
jgi:hypothetical protein